jgi:hypothetical protein
VDTDTQRFGKNEGHVTPHSHDLPFTTCTVRRSSVQALISSRPFRILRASSTNPPGVQPTLWPSLRYATRRPRRPTSEFGLPMFSEVYHHAHPSIGCRDSALRASFNRRLVAILHWNVNR